MTKQIIIGIITAILASILVHYINNYLNKKDAEKAKAAGKTNEDLVTGKIAVAVPCNCKEH